MDIAFNIISIIIGVAGLESDAYDLALSSHFLFYIQSILFLSCSTVNLNPQTYLELQTTPNLDKSKSITLNEFILYDDGGEFPTVRMGIPNGTYYLEAENDSFYYFKSPKGIQKAFYTQCQRSTTDNLKKSVRIPGSVCFPKNPLNKPYTAGIYTNIDNNKKALIWKLGTGFSVFER